jgi:hypothetical protein
MTMRDIRLSQQSVPLGNHRGVIGPNTLDLRRPVK